MIMKCYYSKNRKQRSYRSAGYTLIEVILVIAIIGIIATISYVSYSNFRHNLVVAALKSDLNGAASALESERNFGSDGYPDTIPPTFTPSNNISLNGGSTDYGDTYCIEAVSSEEPSLYYYLDSLMAVQGAQEGSCVSSRPVPQNLAAAMVTNTSINITWDAVSSVGSYTLQQDTDPDFTSPTPFTLTTNSKLSTSLTVDTNYYYRVNATVASATGEWSEVAYANTSVTPPTTPSVDVVYSAPDIVAMASSSVCTTGNLQYVFSSRTNDGTWADGVWASSDTASRSATEGIKYGYKVQARCYVDADTYSSPVASTEDTYIHPFTSIPVAPTVVATTPDSITTNFTWNTTSCPGGAPAHYQYDFTTSYGYDSLWQPTDSTAASFTTASAGYTYTLQVKTQCYTAYSQSAWSGIGSDSYTRPYTISVLVIAGGGGGGAGDSYGNGGGGGAGGYIYRTGFSVAPQSYTVTVGGGGSGTLADGSGSNYGRGNNGANSVFSSLTAIGGGGGGGGGDGSPGTGSSGGSGGGASGSSSGTRPGASGTAGQGNAGGNTCSDDSRGSSGGGGATSAGGANAGCSNNGTAGGSGYTTSISGSSICYAGGGGGGVGSGTIGYGQCGGGNGNASGTGGTGTVNTGGGGGGGRGYGGNGGFGVVIIRHATGAFPASGGNSVYTNGTDTVRVFTGSGTFTIN
jgi:prepilin-type N-terminal cleavage/methylation domain-containing protein